MVNLYGGVSAVIMILQSATTEGKISINIMQEWNERYGKRREIKRKGEKREIRRLVVHEFGEE